MPTDRTRLYARLDHETGSEHLLVNFNSYASPAQGIATPLENFGWFSKLGSSTLWFAESGPRGWYTAFDREINDWIAHAVERHGMRRVTLLGSSCGAYASIRHAQLLAARFASLEAPPDICALAINPQTGFGDDLLDRVRGALHAAGWPVHELGENPVLPAPEDLCASIDSAPTADLPEFASLLALGDAAPRIEVLYDALNPIDLVFCERLAAPNLTLHPHRLAMNHADGSRWLLRSALFKRWVEDRVAGRPPAPVPASAAINATRTRLLKDFVEAQV